MYVELVLMEAVPCVKIAAILQVPEHDSLHDLAAARAAIRVGAEVHPSSSSLPMTLRKLIILCLPMIELIEARCAVTAAWKVPN